MKPAQAKCYRCHCSMTPRSSGIDQKEGEPPRGFVIFECPECLVMVEISQWEDAE